MSFDPQSTTDPARTHWLRWAMSFAIVLGITCAVTATFPKIDLVVGRWFFDASSASWPVAENPFWQIVRKFLWRAADLSCVVAISVVALRTLIPQWRNKRRGPAAFLAISYLLGPGLLVNVLLKEHWGRARPFDVSEFGGDHLFTSALTITNQCVHNCSFVGGEASSFAALFFAVFFMKRAIIHRRGTIRVLAAALCVAVFGSLLRVAFGHHFISDIVFAWAIMFALVAAIAAAFDRLGWDYRSQRPIE